MRAISNTNDFIKKAIKIHGNKYNYDSVLYTGCKNKINITCKDHGDFVQSPEKHLLGRGCSKCAGIAKWSLNDFIIAAKLTHGNKYDYSKSVYKSKNHKIKIICSTHGEFSQYAKNHLRGHGCAKCNGGYKHDLKQFILKAENVHGNKFDYSKSIYTNDRSDIIIGCKTCGNCFNQRPGNHLQGQGCPKCNRPTKLTYDLFLDRANKVHGNKYDYTNVNIKTVDIKVDIICNNHCTPFMFNQTPYKHINVGRGCPKCKKLISKPETKWLNSLGILKENRQISLPGISRNFKVDGYNPDTNTVYEFYGDFWHGNPNVYNLKEINPVTKITFECLYNKTIYKENLIKEAGYDLVVMWEADFKKENK